jgi:cob(I)alamin adenosyltransferase
MEAQKMGHRLSKISTRTGDDGSTGLGDGSRLPKDSRLIEAMGDVDETNCVIGLLIAELSETDQLFAPLTTIQHHLFNIGGEFAMPGYQMLTDEHVIFLDEQLLILNEQLPPLKEFILPGGSRAAAICHLARTTCRRAERHTIHARGEHSINDNIVRYLNRLSDYLFVTSRILARRNDGSEVLWKNPGL